MDILKKAKEILPEIIALRRKVHSWPEIGYQEHRTARLVADELAKISVPFRTGVARTGVLGEIKRGNGSGVLLRADMDALPISEETNLPFASRRKGFMHACGHDAHVAILVGAAKIIADSSFNGSVRFFFQPAEEGLFDDSNELSGAQRGINEGVMDGMDWGIALHQSTALPSKTIGLSSGTAYASADFFKIEVEGKNSHAGAAPHEGIDALLIASEIVLLLQSVVSKTLPPLEAGVVSVGSLHSGSAPNIIADKAVIEGTYRALNENSRIAIRDKIRIVADSTAAMHCGKARFSLTSTVSATINDGTLTEKLRKAAVGLLGGDKVKSVPPTLGGEDFSCYGKLKPCCMALLGSRPKGNGSVYGDHHPKLEIDEECLYVGSAFLAQSALELLAEG